MEQVSKNKPGAVPEPTDSPDEPKAPQKVAETAHRQPRRAEGTHQDDTNTPKETTKVPKGCQRSPKGLQKMTKNNKKHRKHAVLPAWELNSGRKMSSHARKTSFVKT